MHTFQITPKAAVAFGLTWHAFDPFASRHQQITEWRANGNKWSAGYKIGPDQYVGLTADIPDIKVKGRLYSGAALVAVHPKVKGKTVLVLLEAGQGACVVGVLRGTVVIDKWVRFDEVSSVRSDFANRCKNADQNYSVFGTQIPEGGDFGTIDAEIEWAEIVKLGAFASLSSPALIVRFKSDRSAYLGVAALVLIVGVIAFFAWQRWREEQIQRERMLAAQAANDPVHLYGVAVEKLMADPKGFSAAVKNVSYLKGFFGTLQVARFGWVLKSVTCSLAKATCHIEWSADNTRLGTFRDFIAQSPKLPDDWKIQVGPALNRITADFAIKPNQSNIPAKATWPKYQEFLMNEGSAWQKYQAIGLTAQISEPKLIGSANPGDNKTLDALPIAIHAVDWKISSKPWYLVDVLEHLGPSAQLSEFTVTYSGKDVNFTAEGKAYVRKI